MKIMDRLEIKPWEFIVLSFFAGLGWATGEAITKWLAAQL